MPETKAAHIDSPPKPPILCAGCPLRSKTIYQKALDCGPHTLDNLRLRQVAAKRGQLIISQDTNGGTAFTLYAGWAIRYQQLRDGRRQILSFYLPGDIIGFEATSSQRWEFSVRTLTDAALCEFKIEDLYTFVTHQKDSRLHVLEAICKSRQDADKRTIMLSRLPAAQRMAYLIQRLRQRQTLHRGELPKFFYLPLRRYDFADALGLTPVHVSRTLASFKREGILNIKQHTATILDEAKFRTLLFDH